MRADTIACALAVAAALLACGCASTDHVHPMPEGTVRVSEADWSRMAAAAARVRPLEASVETLSERIARLEGRLDPIEQRVELASFRSDRLERLAGGDRRVGLPEGSHVTRAGARPAKRSLARHLANFDGYVISFWATWCVPCISDEELAHLGHLQRQLRRNNVELVSMAIDDLDKVLAHPKAPRWLYPLWHRDDGHLDIMPRALVEAVGVNLPLFLIVSADGEVCQYYNRKLDDTAVRDIVTAAGAACTR